jgi:hypothetical protein
MSQTIPTPTHKLSIRLDRKDGTATIQRIRSGSLVAKDITAAVLIAAKHIPAASKATAITIRISKI